MASERLTDIELDCVHITGEKPRSLAQEPGLYTQEDDIETALGTLHVQVQGDRSKRAIFTYHDIGLNSTSCFQGLFNCNDMQAILNHFCVYHINAPGQEEGSLQLPHGLGFNGNPVALANYVYPTMDQLAEMILPVMQFYGVKRFIGFGMGAGANVLARFGLKHPDVTDALVLINCVSGKSTWSEWGYQKSNCWYLKSGQLTQGVQEYLLWHWFGSHTMRQNYDLVQVFSENMATINPTNLAYFIESYIRREDLGIERSYDHTQTENFCNFKCPVMLVSGQYSPHLDQVVEMNGRLDPRNSDFIKFECGGMVMEEMPHKLTDSFRLFLQGMGYIPNFRPVKMENKCSAMAANALMLESKKTHSNSGSSAASATTADRGDHALADGQHHLTVC